MKFLLIFMTVFVLLAVPGHAQIGEISQDQMQNSDDQEGPSVEEERQSLRYIPASHANLSQLMWKYNMYDITPETLDSYLHAKNCPMYDTYFEDDFIWQNIRESAVREIEYYASTYPDRFEVVTMLRLGRYDFKKSAFEIEEPSRLENEGAISFSFDSKVDLGCKSNRFSPFFPNRMKFNPDNKFSLTNVPVPPNDANKILDRIDTYSINTQSSDRDRYIVLRMHLKVNAVSEVINDEDQSSITFQGQLDEIALFEDLDMEKLIWKTSFKDLQ